MTKPKPKIDETEYFVTTRVGIDCVKPDRHLVRLAKKFGYSSPLRMVEDIRTVYPTERLGTIDYVLWRDCNLRTG